MLAESGIRLADVVEKVGVEVCYDVRCLSQQVLDLRECHSGLM